MNKKNKENNRDAIKTELGYLRDNLIESIREGRQEWVQQGLDIYKELAGFFIDEIQTIAGGTSRNRLISDQSIFGEGWDEVKWLRDDVIIFINEAFSQNNIDILKKIIYFPMSIAIMAFNKKDFYIFREFLNLYPYLLSKSLHLKEIDLRELVLEPCWRHLREFFLFHMAYEIDALIVPSEIEQIESYAVHVLKIFSHFLKEIYDTYLKEGKSHQLLKLFDEIKDQYKLLAVKFMPHYYNETYLEFDKFKLQGIMNEEEKKIFKQQLQLTESKVKFKRKITSLVDISLFGLNAWILHAYDIGILDNKEYKEWHSKFQRYTNLQELTDLFIKTRDFEIEHIFGWDWWELQENKTEDSMILQFDSFLSKLYCIKALEFLSGLDDTQTEHIQISIPKEFTFRVETDDAELMRILNDINANNMKWEPIVPRLKVDAFKSVLKKAAAIKRQENIAHIISSNIDLTKLNLFKADIIKSWKDNTDLRKILKASPKVLGDAPANSLFLGLNYLLDKELFLSDSNFNISSFALSYGEAIAASERMTIVNQIIEVISPFQKPAARDNLIETIGDAVSSLKNKYEDLVILVINSGFISNLMEKDEQNFIHLSENENTYMHFPYYSLNVQGSANKRQGNLILIFDRSKLGKWKQFTPKKIFSDEKQFDVFTFMFKQFTIESAKDVIAHQPEFQKNLDGSDKSEDIAIQELLQKVHLRMLEQFEYKILDQNAGYKIQLLGN